MLAVVDHILKQHRKLYDEFIVIILRLRRSLTWSSVSSWRSRCGREAVSCWLHEALLQPALGPTCLTPLRRPRTCSPPTTAWQPIWRSCRPDANTPSGHLRPRGLLIPSTTVFRCSEIRVSHNISHLDVLVVHNIYL